MDDAKNSGENFSHKRCSTVVLRVHGNGAPALDPLEGFIESRLFPDITLEGAL
jgi:hypothetical protein